MSMQITAAILLLGIGLILYGFFARSRIVLDVGLMATVLGVMNGILQIAVPRR